MRLINHWKLSKLRWMHSLPVSIPVCSFVLVVLKSKMYRVNISEESQGVQDILVPLQTGVVCLSEPSSEGWGKQQFWVRTDSESSKSEPEINKHSLNSEKEKKGVIRVSSLKKPWKEYICWFLKERIHF